VRLLFAGTPAAALPSLHVLRDAGHDIVAVATNPDAPSGRGHKLTPSPVAAEAASLGIPLLQPARARDPWFVDALTELAPELAVVVAWGTLVPDALLTVPEHGWVNLHFSLLPAWRGAAPVQRAIMAGETTTGVTTFQLVHDLDAGPVFRQEAVTIGQDETAGELLARLASIGAEVLGKTVVDIAEGTTPQPQPEGEVTLAPKVTPDDARIDWWAAAETVRNLVRGATPDPGAWTTLHGARVKILRTSVMATTDDLIAGQLQADKRVLQVGTGHGALSLDTVQPAGKPPLDGAAWARGARLNPEDRFE